MKIFISGILMILFVVILLLLVALIRALLLKPTEAKVAKIQLDSSPRAEEYGRKLSTLIRKETVSNRFNPDRTKFYEYHEMLEKMFPLMHEKCEKHVFDGSLLFKWEGSDKNRKPILLMSHSDVVEASGKWKHEPFSGDIDEEGKVWGRGAVDTKASFSCICNAVEELIGDGYKPECDIYIASSCTEEFSGDGAPKTVEYLKSKGVHLGMVLDEGGMIVEKPMAGVNGIYGMVGLVEKGYGDVKFTARSNGGHASAPKKNSPLVRLGAFMSYADSHSLFKSRITPTVEEMFKRMAPNMSFGMKYIFANMWLFKPLLAKLLPAINSTAGAMLKTTMAFTTAKGSEGLNVMPAEAYVTANMRFIAHQPNEESIALVKKLADKYDIDTSVIYQDPPCPVVDYKSDAFKLVEKVSGRIYPGIGICPYVMTGGTDAKYYTQIADACIRFAPLYINEQQLASVHSVDENIYQGALPYGVDFYKEIIKHGL